MNKGQFQKGQIAWNKGLKGVMKPNKTTFKEGRFVGDNHPSWKGGIQKCRDSVYIWQGANKRKILARHIYEEKFGKIPKGFVIYHKDKDYTNNKISNLECISRAELVKRNLEDSRLKIRSL